MAKERSPDLAHSSVGLSPMGQANDAGGGESLAIGDQSPTDLGELLGRAPTGEEAIAWNEMSAALRRRAATRIGLLRRWTVDRRNLTAVDAARIAGVEPNRFYQMASSWRRTPSLHAVGVYAAGGPDRSSKIHPAVNAALQSEVIDVVKRAEGASVEAMRRRLEAAVRARMPAIGSDSGPRMPSPKTIRAVISREQARVAELGMLGESVVLDCCPTAMRGADGMPFDIFAIIDRGTLRILGQAIGTIDDSVDGYGRAATDALARIGAMVPPQPWAAATRRADIVIGTDIASWPRIMIELKDTLRPTDVEEIIRDRRFGSQFRKYVGERIGGIWLRPTWGFRPPPPLADGAETFTADEARRRAEIETSAWNDAKVIERSGGAGQPPSGLCKLLGLLIP